MNNETQSNNQNQSQQPKLRVERVHGGEVVEEIIAPQLINDPNCPHTNMVRDYSETDFIAFICDNPSCGMIKLYQ